MLKPETSGPLSIGEISNFVASTLFQALSRPLGLPFPGGFELCDEKMSDHEVILSNDN